MKSNILSRGYGPGVKNVSRELSRRALSDVKARQEELEACNEDLCRAQKDLDLARGALVESEKRLRLVITNSPISVFTQDRGRKFTWMHKPGDRLRPQEIPGRRDSGVFPAAIAPRLTQIKRRVLESGQRAREEIRVDSPDGATFFDVVVEPLRGPAGKITGLLGMAIDTTENKRSAEEVSKLSERIRRQAKTLETVLAGSPDPVYQFDRAHRYTYVNPAGHRIFGLSAEKMKGRTWRELGLPGKVMLPFAKRLERAFLTGKSGKGEAVVPGRMAERIYEYIITPLKGPDGESLTAIATFRDVTGRKAAGEVLKRDKEMFERLVREKTTQLLAARVELENSKRLSDIGVLAATVAHELRNPLAAITLAAANIRRKAANPLLDRHLQTITSKLSESEEIINNLLFYSRIRTPRFQETFMHDSLRECMEHVQERFKKPVKLLRNIEPLSGISIQADPTQMKEVFINLLNNAYDALPEADGEIEVSSGDCGDFIKVVLRDNGSGMGPEELKNVFTPFFTTKAKGTGLGLSVCSQLVNMHGGRIRIASAPAKGTSVTVTLPKSQRMK